MPVGQFATDTLYIAVLLEFNTPKPIQGFCSRPAFYAGLQSLHYEFYSVIFNFRNNGYCRNI